MQNQTDNCNECGMFKQHAYLCNNHPSYKPCCDYAFHSPSCPNNEPCFKCGFEYPNHHIWCSQNPESEFYYPEKFSPKYECCDSQDHKKDCPNFDRCLLCGIHLPLHKPQCYQFEHLTDTLKEQYFVEHEHDYSDESCDEFSEKEEDEDYSDDE